MQVFLPPSETKRAGGSGRWASSALSHASALAPARDLVKRALRELSVDEAAAIRALKLGAKSRAELAHNLELESSGTLPTIERYTGVLYDALDVSDLDGAARQWISAHVSVQSSLFGLIGADDPIPAYRLSASSRLQVDGGATLQAVWRAAHESIDWRGLGWILDLRSKDYATLAPLPQGSGATLQVVQRSEIGVIRALNHFNKAAKGDLVRRLARTQAQPESAAQFVDWATENGLEMRLGSDSAELILVTDLHAGGARSQAQRSALRAG